MKAKTCNKVHTVKDTTSLLSYLLTQPIETFSASEVFKTIPNHVASGTNAFWGVRKKYHNMFWRNVIFYGCYGGVYLLVNIQQSNPEGASNFLLVTSNYCYVKLVTIMLFQPDKMKQFTG